MALSGLLMDGGDTTDKNYALPMWSECVYACESQ